MIVNNILCGGPTLKVPGHISFSQHVIESLRKNCENGEEVVLLDHDSGCKITNKQLLQEIVNIAAGLKKMGIKRGDVVGICSENRNEYFPAVIGTTCCGATVTTLNMIYTEDELRHALNISQPNLIFGSENGLKRNLKIFQSVQCVENIIQLNGTPVESGVVPLGEVAVETDAEEYQPAAVRGCEDVVFILYSSGTTGMPKGVMLTHLNVLYACATIDYGYLHSLCSRYLLILPWFHAYGLIVGMHYLTCNKMIVYFTGYTTEKYLQAIEKYKINSLLAAPPIIVSMAKYPLIQKYDLSSVRMILSGAAPLSAEITNDVLKHMPNCKKVLQGYGMTETTLGVAKDYDDEETIVKHGSAGYTMPGVKIKIVNIETRETLGAGQNGEICVKTPSAMKGYIRNEAATREMIDSEGYLKTGDIGYYDEDGCVFVVDRLKELIKYKGHQVPPAAIERVVMQHSGVADCGVVGAPDELAGELPTAFVVAKPGVQLTQTELLSFTDERLSSVSRLRGGIIFVDEIPKNPSGKILRRALKQILLK